MWASTMRFLGVAAIVLAAVGAEATPPAIFDLGDFAARAVNEFGQVAGQGQHAVRYDRTPSGGTLWDLGTLGGGYSSGNDVNASGQVVGWSDLFMDDYMNQHAFLYEGTPGQDGTMRDLGTLGGASSWGYAINDAGQIAGASYTSGGATHAFRYDGTLGQGGVMRDLGTFGGARSIAFGINNAGQVVGYSMYASTNLWHAFRYDGTPGAGGVMRDLGTGQAVAINSAGQVAGDTAEPDAPVEAFRYDGTPGQGGVMRKLGTLPGGKDSRACAINSAGCVAGYVFMPAPQPTRGYLYVGTPGEDGRMIDLDAWFDANNPAEGAKWSINAAYGLNDDGWITGYGYYSDGPGGLPEGQRAFILDASSLTIPEPCTLTLLILAGTVVLRRRNHLPSLGRLA